MKAAIFHGAHKPLTIEQVEIDKPIGREVLVRTVASGVCHSDLHFVDGFYPFPTGAHRTGLPAPADLAARFSCPALAIFGGADQAIPSEARDEFDAALNAVGIEHRIVVYEGAPHSFFDRKALQYADASANAWRQVLDFMGVSPRRPS